MTLNSKQKEAVEYLEGPLLVLAGPGTGKTHLLSARVENILKKTDTNPENILCLTFTENGATNMRLRLLSTVREAARKLQIHTYHAFGADLLSQYKNYAEKYDRELDEPIDDVKKYRMIKKIQGELPAMNILKRGAVKDIISTISSAKSARLTPGDLIKIAEMNESLSAELNFEISPILGAARKGARYSEAVKEVYFPIFEILQKHFSKKPILKDIEAVANPLGKELAEIISEEDARLEAGEKVSVKGLTAWRNANFELDDKGEWRLKDRISNKKLRAVGEVMEKYQVMLEKEGLYDFDDMIEEAIKMLKKDRGFRLTLQERFQYILLDEFQDTNPSQAEIIKLLTDYEKPNVMAVGDDDQAIFAFQGAEASNLLTFQQFYKAKVVNLEENYRSKQEILDFSRKIADQIEDSFAKKQNVPKILKAFKGKGAELSRHEFLTNDQEYQFVTDEILKLIKAGVKQSEIAIIAPKHKYIAPILPFLKESGKINIAYERRDNIFEDVRLSEILTLSRFVYDLSQGKNISSRLLEILAFPFWKIPAGEAISTVFRAKNDHKAGLDYLLKSESKKIKEVGEFLAKLAMVSFDTPLELMIDYMVGTVELDDFRSPFLEFYAKEQGDYETFELYENLAVLKQALESYVSGREKGVRLKDLVEMAKDYEEAEIALTNTSPYRDSEDAVQIVTAHKSKGLEYTYVFLVAVDHMSWGKGKGNNNLLSLPKNMLQIRHTGVTDDERLRLFFVAITRAKTVLCITNSLKDFSGKSPARLEYLGEYEDENGDVISPYIREDGKYKIKQHYDDLRELRKVVDLRKTWRSAYAKHSPELKPILLKRMENYRLTASDLTSFVDITFGGPMIFYQNKVLLTPQPPADANITFGNLLHSVFEKVTNEKISDATAIKMFRSEAEKTDLTETEVKDLLEGGEVSLKISLETFGDLLRAQNSRAEVDFRAEHLTVEGIPVTGKIDHIQVNDEKKTIEIFDFKTGTYHKEKWGSVSSLYRYSLQLGFYKLILEASPRYKNYKVTKGHILFVRPDDEGKVYDKELDFDEFERKEEPKLKAMMVAVYHQATTLEFLDDEELRIEPDKKRSFKEVKEFIALLLEKSGKIG